MRQIYLITTVYFSSHVILDLFAGFNDYSEGWKIAQGYISDSVGTGSLVIILVAGIWVAFRNKIF